jgi:ParB family chromosome partitioning protein
MHGQLIPALGRLLRDDPAYDVELIYGARRLYVARQLEKPLLVELRQLNDRQAAVAMDIENRQRRDLSPYERGLSFAQWLRARVFQSQDDIARALNISSAQVSRLLKLSRLPSVIVAAFGSPLQIREEWGLELAEAMQDPHRRQRTIQAARELAEQALQISPRSVYRRLLMASVRGRRVRSGNEEIVRDGDGAPLFRIKHQTNAIALVLNTSEVTTRSLERIRRAIEMILQSANAASF